MGMAEHNTGASGWLRKAVTPRCYLTRVLSKWLDPLQRTQRARRIPGSMICGGVPSSPPHVPSLSNPHPYACFYRLLKTAARAQWIAHPPCSQYWTTLGSIPLVSLKNSLRKLKKWRTKQLRENPTKSVRLSCKSSALIQYVPERLGGR